MLFTELKAFHAVACAGGFVRAAEVLNRSQPTLTAQIRNLEKRYKVELFFRNRGQRARLTPLGERLHILASQMLHHHDDAERVLAAAGKIKGGSLRIGAISSRWTIELMTHMARKYPDLDLRLTIENSQQLLEKVLDYQVDVALLGAHKPDPTCHMRLLSRPEVVFVTSTEHPLAAKGQVSRDEFSTEVLLHREPGSETRAIIEQALSENDYVAGRVIPFGNREGTQRAAENGLGLAPISIEEIPRSARLSIIRPTDFTARGEIHVVCIKSRLGIPIVQEAFDFLSKL